LPFDQRVVEGARIADKEFHALVAEFADTREARGLLTLQPQ